MSTKIEKFKQEKSDHVQMVGSAYKAMNLYTYERGDRDKHGLSIGSKWHDRGEPMGYLIGYSGFYGSSECTYECTARLAMFLKIVINKNMKQLVEEAIELSEKSVEEHRLDAIDDANLILTETA